MKLWGGLLLTAALLAATASCQPDEERPPPPPPCTGSQCVPPGGWPPSKSSGGSLNGEGGQGGEDAGGTANGGTSATGELTGTVREFVDLYLQNSVLFTGTATLSAQAAGGGLVNTRWNGVDPFQLSGLVPEGLTWVHATPERNQGVLATMHPVEVRSLQQDLGLVRADNLDLVFLLLTVPSERLPGRAQLVLVFADPSSPLGGQQGVRVALPEAEFISYAVQGTWSELETQTENTGLVVLGNIAAPAFPGSTRRVALGGTRSGSIDVRLAADTVSLVEVAPL